jgi:L,D-peptidoglycan transpeptidase YkuD (ErfK/YbiS/YcfS/YnhG family)
MRTWLQALVLVAVAPNAFAKAPQDAPSKLITVVTDRWGGTTGELRRWERGGGKWHPTGEPTPVVVGKTGLAWPADKHEGDGHSPAGRFAIGDATGYDPALPGVRLRYRQAADDTLRCVDDPRSSFYNQLMDTGLLNQAPSWASDEHMRRDDDLYHYTIFVHHNPTRTPGAGSCIFLHVWRDAKSPTVGCTAMSLIAMAELLTWATPSTELVQLPRDEYKKRQREWDLPPLTQRK